MARFSVCEEEEEAGVDLGKGLGEVGVMGLEGRGGDAGPAAEEDSDVAVIVMTGSSLALLGRAW